jgi:arylsulfatase A-like enzyme
MKSRFRPAGYGLALCGLLCIGCGTEPPGVCRESGPPVTIVLLSLDTLRADMLGAYGFEIHPTSPVLDEFAAANVLFERSIVQEPRTLTSHMSLLTGAFPQHHGVRPRSALGPELLTLAEILREAGYSTQAFVDGGWLDERWGFARGFDEFRNYRRQGLDAIVPDTSDWLERNPERPAFLFLHTYDVHSAGPGPWYEASPAWRVPFSEGVDSQLRSASWEEFEPRWEQVRAALSQADRQYIRARYAEGVRHADSRVGELLEKLQRVGRYECALIVVWSDHGEGLYDHDDWSHSELFDHTIRGPLLMRIPGYPARRGRVASVVSSVDIAPTVLEIVGLPVPTSMDGASLLPLLEREDSSRVAISIRSSGAGLEPWRRFSIRSQRHHLIWNQDEGAIQFFDLDTDPGERQNLHPSGTPAEQRLRRELESWIAGYDAALSASTRAETQPLLDDEVSGRLKALGYLEEPSRGSEAP